jgi:transcriptional regulator with XRE-family HTH domain
MLYANPDIGGRMSDPFSWSEGNNLVNSVGGEEWLAARIERERKARGLSQAQLSKALAEVGHPMHQSAISKIESPPKGDGRRSITIDETIGFSKVFGIPIGELLLPPDTVEIVQGLKDLSSGPDLLGQMILAEARYSEIVKRLATQVRSNATMRETWVERFVQEQKKVADWGADPSDSISLRFMRDLASKVEELGND